MRNTVRNTAARSAEIIFVKPESGADCVMSLREMRHAVTRPSFRPPTGVTKQVPTKVDRRHCLPSSTFERADIDRAIETSTRGPCLASRRAKEREIERSFDNRIETKKMLYEENKKIHVDFGEVETGATTIKCLEIVNESCVSVQLLVYI